ncbi:DNA-binding response regulator [Bacteroides faecis]|jgi:hypothetical protein|nr:DNA-binding response regulator [Bacteroides faecis]KAA5272044.1 response regulator transcription factor [Bacteroides faecis]MCE9007804.1 DNA-binding response regulator [Bacteroides faecis]MCS2651586.1 DNA-binding response regulator [Bacteroides faecis]RYT93099.1 DNA-binding response regulator [Bacteroides faecis]UYU56917.1 DNA-binding response regulator [Bacteroides faecis]
MNRGKYSISHNRIRHIYEDWDKDLWIATDGGINRFDYATETFENYQIADSTHTRNANWTYYINGDNHSNLYLVAYCGGVFVVNKEKLLSQKGKLYVADENYYHHSGENSLHNAECLLAYNGKKGMEMALQYSPDVIIADIMMPVMNGVEMVKQLKANLTTSTIPVIMLTAKDDKKTEYNLLSLGIEAFISKPFDIKELVAHIDRILRNKYRLVRKLKEEGISLETDTVITESPDEKFLTYITEVIEQNLSNSDLNVTRLSELSGYHSKQIYRRVKQLTGYTTVEYIKGIRMKKAAMLLAKKQFMISEVMYMVGFSDSSYFSKCFVEKYGKTPRQYMENM